MTFCGPHLPLAFQFVCGPGGGGAANKLEGKRKVSLYLVAPPQAAAGYCTNSSICWRTPFRNLCLPYGSFFPHATTFRDTLEATAELPTWLERPVPFNGSALLSSVRAISVRIHFRPVLAVRLGFLQFYRKIPPTPCCPDLGGRN